MEDCTFERCLEDYIELFRKTGKGELFRWIECIIRGILEIQELGIFHTGLEFRNTIKIRDREGEGEYKYKIFNF